MMVVDIMENRWMYELAGRMTKNNFHSICRELKSMIGRLAVAGEVWQQSNQQPYDVSILGWILPATVPWKGRIFLYQGGLYDVTGEMSEEQRALLVRKAREDEVDKFERLRARFASHESTVTEYLREAVSESVRIEVWRRDGGKCVKCGSRCNLEYDHIIPVSKGGSNTARNIELLCEACNRAKSARIE